MIEVDPRFGHSMWPGWPAGGSFSSLGGGVSKCTFRAIASLPLSAEDVGRAFGQRPLALLGGPSQLRPRDRCVVSGACASPSRLLDLGEHHRHKWKQNSIVSMR